MQASLSWSPPTGTLGKIVGEAHARALLLEASRPQIERMAAARLPANSLLSALKRDSVTLIAEVKRRSPSKGAIAAGLSAAAQARAYAGAGAAAISCLTEPNHFGGCDEDLATIRDAVTVPVLKKDFHVAPIQLLQARALGASAALIIVRAISPRQLTEMMQTAREIQLELLVEIRNESELELALAAGATMIGVNNRNLESLEIDAATAERVIPLIPADVVAIAESGITSRADVERYAAIGADAVLVGSSLSASPHPGDATRTLAGVARRARAS